MNYGISGLNQLNGRRHAQRMMFLMENLRRRSNRFSLKVSSVILFEVISHFIISSVIGINLNAKHLFYIFQK